MDHRIDRVVPQHLIEALDASIGDVAEGRVQDAQAVQTEARRMLADHEKGLATRPTPGRTGHGQVRSIS